MVNKLKVRGGAARFSRNWLFLPCDAPQAYVEFVDHCADLGDGPWDGKVPKEALAEIKQAKGKVFEMGENPWW